MSKTDWVVRIPAGRWMAGVHHFRTKKRAVEFYDRWNQVEVNSGNKSLQFYRFGPSTFEALEAR